MPGASLDGVPADRGVVARDIGNSDRVESTAFPVPHYRAEDDMAKVDWSYHRNG